MQFSSTMTRLAAAATVAAGITAASEATFVQFIVVKTQVTTGGVLLDQYQVKARFNGPTDTLLNCFNLVYQGGATVPDPHGAFYHKDNQSYNSGVLSKQYGTWAPGQTGSATLNRPFDSFLILGGTATPTNTTSFDPSWISGGSGSHAADGRAYNRPDLLNNGTMGWFNSAPPNLQGRVGIAPNTATDVLVCQFVVDRGAELGTWSLTMGFNDGVSGSSVQFATALFALCPGGQEFYRDLDGDGFGSTANGTTIGCAAPSGYVANNTDCNDSNAAINPNTVWSRDLDGDGFGAAAGGTLTQCTQPAGYALSNTDCNDANPAINPNTVWSRDLDGDGFGSSGDGTLVQCAQPTGYVLNNTDNCPSLANPGQEDCNGNGTGDRCEIAAGTLFDCDSDGLADACEGGSQVRRTSTALAPLGAGTTLSYSFTGLPLAYGNGVRLTLDATGDLDSTNEFLGLTFDGGAFEYFFINGATLCPSVPNRAVRNFTNAQFNALVADGTLAINIVPSGTVSAAECPTSNIRLTLDYTTLGSGADCNGNALLDSCEIGNGLVADCNNNLILDTCELTAGTATDCNANGALDSCDLAAGTSTDLDGNGKLDECSGEFVVGGSGYATIQAAIAAAPSGTVIRVGAGTYSGPLAILDKRLTLRSIAGAASTVISGSGIDTSILAVSSPAAGGTVIDGFTFRDGTVGTAAFGLRLGGAIYLISTSADITNCRFIGNSAIYGGAVYGYSYSGAISNCLFDGNHAIDDSGAVQVGFGGNTVLSNNTFLNNSAGRNGGALQVVQGDEPPVSSSSVQNCVFRSNTAAQGAGAIAWYAGLGGDLPISGCTVESNTSPGAVVMRVPGSTSTTSRFVLADSRFCLNTAGNIGGPFLDNGGNTLSQDCNANGLCDADEIAAGTVADCDHNGLPDSCQLGKAVAWGENGLGQSTVPASLGSPRAISAGCDHALAINENAQVVAWGSNSFGQRTVPSSVTTALAVAAGCDHSLALRTDGTVAAWGYNAFGQTNVPAAANGSVAQIAAGANHSGVRKTNGSLVLWGRNADGECNVPSALGAATKLALGGAHSMALRGNGTVVCWGLNNFGQCNVPANSGTLVDIAAGCYHSVGLRSDGTVRAWGSNIFGQTSVPAGLSGVVKIAAGSGQHTIALTADDEIIAWGWNAFGQTTVPSAASGPVSMISAGGTFSLARLKTADDCDSNGAIDSCELASGAVADCNANGVVDTCDIASGASVDCNANGTPDSCELASGAAADCNGNGTLDSCDIASGFAADCNSNGRPDTCDLASGASTDLNSNGRPDECTGEWVVGGSGFATIQAAVNAATSGTTLRIGAGTFAPADLGAKSVSIEPIGAFGSVIIDGGGTQPCLKMNGIQGAQPTFRNLVLRNGVAENGGGIAIVLSSPTVQDCTIEDCVASVDGGGILSNGGAPLIERCTIRRCAAASGGAIAAIGGASGSGVRVVDCVLDDNAATTQGGAVFSKTLFSMTGSQVLRSVSSLGAGARFDPTGSASVGTTRFCLNEGENISGPYSNLGGNVLSQDCNGNGICDADEIASGAEADCDQNGIPDSCQIGTLFGFGENTQGQLGFPAGTTGAKEISAGCTHALALKPDGTVAAWGGNAFGQSNIPASVVTALSVSAGCDHSLALRSDGTVAAWGYNQFGQTNVPTQANGNVAQIAAGVNHSGVRKTDGSLVMWGRNLNGECNVPGGLGAATKLALGGAHSMVIRADGTVVCWGLNNFGQCSVPANAGTLQDVTAGCYHTVGLRTDGTVRAWGSNIFGQTSVPAGLSNVVKVTSGCSGQHTLALKSDGTVVGWGWNQFGQASIPNATKASALAAGGSFSIVRSPLAFDCNGNGVPDACDLASGAALDCNGNAIPDSCDIASGYAFDCNANGKPDSCDIASGFSADCNGNSVPDSCDIASGYAADCNGNAVPDSCDLASGASTDLNSSNVPDECEFVVGGSGYSSIQAAVNAAPNGTTIVVGNGTWSPISITARSLTIRSINGPASASISGNGTARVLDISNIAPRSLTIEGFTIRDGLSAIGAGLRVTNGSPTIRGCVITGNVSTGVGGGVACLTSSALFEQCTISDNLAVNGGGIAIIGFAASGLPNQFDSCQVNGNDSSGPGAGTYNAGALLLTGCEYLDNTAVGSGGGLFTAASASSAIATSYFCVNRPSNTTGAYTDLGGNTFGDDCNNNGICDVTEIAEGAEDANHNLKLDECELARGDLNLDGVVNGFDLGALLSFWGAVNPPVGDLNGDGVISGFDLAIILSNWGN